MLYVEVSPLLSKQLTGIGRFTAHLVEALAIRTPLRLVSLMARHESRVAGLSTGLARGEAIAIEPGDLPPANDGLDAWVRDLLRRRKSPHDLAASRRAPGIYTQARPDGRHFAREIAILYDFTPVLLPETHEPWARRLFGGFFARGLAASDKALAISESTKADARWLCPMREDDIAVAYPGPSLCSARHASAAEAGRHGARFLVVATREPRKNASFLVEWFLETRSLPAAAELCWVGPAGWLTERSSSRLRRRGREIRFAGMVSDARLCELYRKAAATIYPSLYEGFGFPVLDSLLHGTPVACSYNSALKEFEGPGVFYFDPFDPPSLDGAVGEMLAAPPFDRPDLRQRCSWDRVAETVLQLCGLQTQGAVERRRGSGNVESSSDGRST